MARKTEQLRIHDVARLQAPRGQVHTALTGGSQGEPRTHPVAATGSLRQAEPQPKALDPF